MLDIVLFTLGLNADTEDGGGIPDGFEAVTQDTVVVTQGGEPVYVPE